MSNPILQSEGFERAACQLQRAMDRFDTSAFEASVQRFERSVDKLARVMGMQAENDQRKAIGASMAYPETAFLNA